MSAHLLPPLPAPFSPSFSALALALALLIDAALGEPPNVLHPVVWMGRAIGALQRRAPASPRAALAYGAAIALAVPAASGVAGALALHAAAARSPLAALVLAAFLLKSTFAVRALGRAAARMRHALAAGDLAGARAALSHLCSRDPSALDAAELAGAAIESVAENTSDSVVAPLLFFVVFGVPGALAYRAVNTLDAMIGYHGRFEWLGKASARLDDALNFVPARLTAALLLAAGALLGADARHGLAVFRRDRRATESPNAGRPMSAMAGLLRVELTKRECYRLGDPLTPLAPDTIALAWRVALLASALAATAALLTIRARW